MCVGGKGGGVVDNERCFAMEPRLRLTGFLLLAGIKPRIARSTGYRLTH